MLQQPKEVQWTAAVWDDGVKGGGWGVYSAIDWS